MYKSCCNADDYLLFNKRLQNLSYMINQKIKDEYANYLKKYKNNKKSNLTIFLQKNFIDKNSILFKNKKMLDYFICELKTNEENYSYYVFLMGCYQEDLDDDNLNYDDNFWEYNFNEHDDIVKQMLLLDNVIINNLSYLEKIPELYEY